MYVDVDVHAAAALLRTWNAPRILPKAPKFRHQVGCSGRPSCLGHLSLWSRLLFNHGQRRSYHKRKLLPDPQPRNLSTWPMVYHTAGFGINSTTFRGPRIES